MRAMPCRRDNTFVIGEVVTVIIVHVAIIVVIQPIPGNLSLVCPEAALQVGMARIYAAIHHGHDNLSLSCSDGPRGFYVDVGTDNAAHHRIAFFIRIVADIATIVEVPLPAVERVVKTRGASIVPCRGHVDRLKAHFLQLGGKHRLHKRRHVAPCRVTDSPRHRLRSL